MIVLVVALLGFLPYFFLRAGEPALNRIERMFVGSSPIPIVVGYLAPAIMALSDPAFVESDSARKFFTLGGLYLSAALLCIGLALIIAALRQGHGAKAPLLVGTLVAGLPLLFVILVGMLWIGH